MVVEITVVVEIATVVAVKITVDAEITVALGMIVAVEADRLNQENALVAKRKALACLTVMITAQNIEDVAYNKVHQVSKFGTYT